MFAIGTTVAAVAISGVARVALSETSKDCKQGFVYQKKGRFAGCIPARSVSVRKNPKTGGLTCDGGNCGAWTPEGGVPTPTETVTETPPDPPAGESWSLQTNYTPPTTTTSTVAATTTTAASTTTTSVGTTTTTIPFDVHILRIYCYTEGSNYRDCIIVKGGTPNGPPLPAGYGGVYGWTSVGNPGHRIAGPAAGSTTPAGWTVKDMRIYCYTEGTNYRDCVIVPQGTPNGAPLPAGYGGVQNWIDVGSLGVSYYIGTNTSPAVPGYTKVAIRYYCYAESPNYRDCVTMPAGTANGPPLPAGYGGVYGWVAGGTGYYVLIQ